MLGERGKFRGKNCERVISVFIARLFFVGGALQPADGEEHGKKHCNAYKTRGSIRKIRHQDGSAAADRAHQVNGQDCAALAQAQISQAMRGMIFSRRGGRKQAATSAGAGDESGVKNRGAEDEYRSEPGDERGSVVQAELE